MAEIGAFAVRTGEVFGWLGARGLAPAGPPFLRYDVIDIARQIEIDNGVPVAAPVDGESNGEFWPAYFPPGATRRSPTWVTPASSWRPPRRCWTGPPNRA